MSAFVQCVVPVFPISLEENVVSMERSPEIGEAPSSGSGASGYGWIAFAAIMLSISGTFNVIDGILALTKSSFFVVNARFVFSDLDTWAWIVIVSGVIEVIAALTLGTGSEFARWYCIAAASLNIIVQLLFVQAYPFWTITLVAINGLVIYALAVYAGGRLRM